MMHACTAGSEIRLGRRAQQEGLQQPLSAVRMALTAITEMAAASRSALATVRLRRTDKHVHL
jgi:hypothetical protein